MSWTAFFWVLGVLCVIMTLYFLDVNAPLACAFGVCAATFVGLAVGS